MLGGVGPREVDINKHCLLSFFQYVLSGALFFVVCSHLSLSVLPVLEAPVFIYIHGGYWQELGYVKDSLLRPIC